MSKPTAAAVDARLKKIITAQSAPSMVPVKSEPTPKPTDKEVEIVPTLAEVVGDTRDRLEILRLVQRSADLQTLIQAVAGSKRERDKVITPKLKALAARHGLTKALCGDYRIVYYNSPRKRIDPRLLELAGVSRDTILACTLEEDSYTLRVLRQDQKEDVEE